MYTYEVKYEYSATPDGEADLRETELIAFCTCVPVRMFNRSRIVANMVKTRHPERYNIRILRIKDMRKVPWLKAVFTTFLN